MDPSQTINKAIIRPIYPIPTLEENLHRLTNAKIFSTFDIREAFQHIPLTEESSFLTTMHTPWGRYRWTRLPFGVSSSPEEFQRRIHEVLEGLTGVVSIPDDTTVVGSGDDMREVLKDHDKTTAELLKRLHTRGVKLNPDKVRFKSVTAPFMGHVLTSEGLKPSADAIAAVAKMAQPTDKTSVRRFLGTVNYLAKFCPRLSVVVKPLHDLTHKDKSFIWAEQHTAAFLEAIRLVTSAPCLRYFSLKDPVVLQVDASEYGLGAVLLQPHSEGTGLTTC